LAIIFLTVALKLLTWPLSAKAYVSMGKMRELAPKMQLLQEKHGDNRQAMSQELMEVYKKEGVNPLGGCLPMLAQMPFFLAFYWVLLETVELRHSPFFLWIDDLSAMDPYFILPILNGAGMYLSQKLTPTPPNADPMQAQMMKFFPLIFAVIFAWFPSGLVLYWLVNMVIQIFQQWWYSRGTKYGTGSVGSG
jgi:YidC/Oxa1 family membrane protein insertase